MLLDDILGHDRVREGLKSAAATDTVHHAMLFSGPEGVGKGAVARAFAALAACPNPSPSGDACGTCRSCERILSHQPGEETRHPDVLWLSPQGSAVIKIAQVRDLLGIIPYPPLEARVRTVVIEPADAMNVEAANALLKTLEEPPSSTRFILITSRPDALLSTIRSRCQAIHFGRLTDEEVERGLSAAGVGRRRLAGARPWPTGASGSRWSASMIRCSRGAMRSSDAAWPFAQATPPPRSSWPPISPIQKIKCRRSWRSSCASIATPCS